MLIMDSRISLILIRSSRFKYIFALIVTSSAVALVIEHLLYDSDKLLLNPPLTNTCSRNLYTNLTLSHRITSEFTKCFTSW